MHCSFIFAGKMQTCIPIHEPFRKAWNEPQIIVTQEDIVEYEKSQNCVSQTGTNNTSESQVKSRLNSNGLDNDPTRKEIVQRRLMDLQNSLLRSRMVEQRLQTPKKECGNACADDSGLSSRLLVSTANSENFDRVIPNYSMSRSRSLPASPVCGELPNTTLSPKIPCSPHGHFSFIPETLRFLEDLEQLQEADDVDNGVRQSQGCFAIPQGKFAVGKLLSVLQIVCTR